MEEEIRYVMQKKCHIDMDKSGIPYEGLPLHISHWA